MMRSLAVCLVVLVGCGPSAAERYKLESDVLAKLESELHAAKSEAERAEFLQLVQDHHAKEPPSDASGFGERFNQTKEEALADLKAAKAAEPAAMKRLAELEEKVEAQRAKVREAEESL